MGPIPEWGRSPGGGHGNPPQYSCLENPMDRGAWWAAVHRVAKSRTGVSNSHTRTQDAGVKADKWNQRSKQTRRNCPPPVTRWLLTEGKGFLKVICACSLVQCGKE